MKVILAMQYLDTELRLSYTNPITHKSNISKANNRTSLRIILFKIYHIALLFLLSIYGDKNRKIYLSISRNSDLEKILENDLQSTGVQILSNPRSLNEVLKMRQNPAIMNIAESSLALHTIHLKIKKKGLLKFLADERNIKKLDLIIKDRVILTQSILTRLNVSSLILQNEHCFHEKIVCMAAKRLNIKVIIVAHGYITCNALVTIAPISADFLFVWTHEQKLFVTSRYSVGKHKVLYEGWPFNTLSLQERSDEKYLLIVLTELEDILTEQQFKLTIKTIERLSLSNEKVRVRLHPTNVKNHRNGLQL